MITIKRIVSTYLAESKKKIIIYFFNLFIYPLKSRRMDWIALYLSLYLQSRPRVLSLVFSLGTIWRRIHLSLSDCSLAQRTIDSSLNSISWIFESRALASPIQPIHTSVRWRQRWSPSEDANPTIPASRRTISGWAASRWIRRSQIWRNYSEGSATSTESRPIRPADSRLYTTDTWRKRWRRRRRYRGRIWTGDCWRSNTRDRFVLISLIR